MVVYAVMRGTSLVRLFTTERLAQQYAAKYNAEFNPRGTRATVIPQRVHSED